MAREWWDGPCAPAREGVPWHRVVNSRGETGVRDPAGSQLQRALLEEEGVEFGLDGKLDLKVYGWDEI